MKGEVNFNNDDFFKISIEEARQIAASAWCKTKTRHKVMDPALAEEFAKILQREITLRVRNAEFETIEEMTKIYEPKMNEHKVPLHRIETTKGTLLGFEPQQIVHLQIGDDRKSYQP